MPFTLDSAAGQSNNATTSGAIAPGSLFGGGSTPGASSPSLFGQGQGQAPGSAGFSFGKPGGNTSSTPTSGTPGGLFDGAGAKPVEQKPSLFGGSSAGINTPSGGSGGLFGGAGGSSQPAASGGLFGNGNSQPASGGSSLFGGGASKPAQSPSLFGNNSSTPSSSAANASSTTMSAFPAGGLFGNKDKSNTAGTPTSQSDGLFGGGNTGAATTSTPAKPLLGGASTTPAGAPPTDAAKPTGGMFGGLNDKAAPVGSSGGGLFGSAKPATQTSSLFGAKHIESTPAAEEGSLFGGAKPAEKAPESSTTSSMFGAKPAISENITPSAPTSSLFGAKPADSSSAKPAGSLFGGASSSTPTTSSGGTPSLFGGLNKSSTSAPAIEPAKPAISHFGAASTSATTPTSNTATSEAPKPANSLFGSAAPATTTSSTTPSTGATTTTAPTSSSLFGGAKPAETSTGTQNVPSAGTNLGASTTGPTSQLARLKNKTMDEIITRWATDLSKYQKEFQTQAAQIAAWDRLLVENGQEIQNLYLKTFEAEKASVEVERHLTTVESQQEELESWLDKYEADVDQMFARDIGRNEQLTGPDQERDKTYKMAEKLTERLDEMGRDLTNMIKEINDVSGTLSKGNKPDDPLSQIVRVLNGHLAQLQWIDSNTAALQAKVNAAQKASASIGSQYGGQENDAAESFYRSYMGRR